MLFIGIPVWGYLMRYKTTNELNIIMWKKNAIPSAFISRIFRLLSSHTHTQKKNLLWYLQLTAIKANSWHCFNIVVLLIFNLFMKQLLSKQLPCYPVSLYHCISPGNSNLD